MTRQRVVQAADEPVPAHSRVTGTGTVVHGVVACANGARGEEVQGRRSELLRECKMKPVIFGKGHEGAAHDDVLNLDQGAVRFEELQ